MSDTIFIETGKQLTLEQYAPIASQTLSLIADAAEDLNKIVEIFSVADLSVLLNKITAHMPGAFEICPTASHYRQIVYKSYPLNAAEFDDRYVATDFAKTHDVGQNCLWISEKAFFAFMDRKLHGVATMVYFYLAYLMTHDEVLALSPNFSFEKILASCDEFPEDCRPKYPTTLMRALADLQNAGLVKWNAKSGTFELLHITPYDPKQKV